jgi:hypothetical protein
LRGHKSLPQAGHRMGGEEKNAHLPQAGEVETIFLKDVVFF